MGIEKGYLLYDGVYFIDSMGNIFEEHNVRKAEPFFDKKRLKVLKTREQRIYRVDVKVKLKEVK